MQFAKLDSSRWGQFARRSRLPLRWVYAVEQQRFFAYERHIARTFSHALVCTAAEQRDFERLIPGVPVSLVGNGSLSHLQALAQQGDPPHFLAPGYR